uniref:AIFM2 protein n=1 Tax=Fopius arisanus TaxID=64838 RepID=A0A0C9RCZ9_9HYME
MDFFLWGYLKDKVYEVTINTPEKMIARLHGAVALIAPEMLRRVEAEVVRRAQLCLDPAGGHFEQVCQVINSDAANEYSERDKIKAREDKRVRIAIVVLSCRITSN